MHARITLTWGALLTVACGAVATSRADTLTEWQVPFADSQPFKLVASGGSVFYVNNAFEQHLGRLDVGTSRFTEWPLPFAATSPCEIVARVGDGALFMTGATAGEIAQFDPASQTLRRWLVADPDSGPWGLAVDGQGRVLFRAIDATNSRTFIGRLDTTVGTVTTWLVPDSIATISAGDMAALPGGSVFFNVFGPTGSFLVATLDPASGLFTAWQPPMEPAWAVTADAAGNVYFQEQNPTFAIARLVPASGALTEWTPPGFYNDDLAFGFGRVAFGNNDPTGVALLDPTQPGQESTLTPFASDAVTPTSVTVTPVVATLTGQEARGHFKRRRVDGVGTGAFTTWAVPSSPRMVAFAPDGLYFSEGSANAIGRITP